MLEIELDGVDWPLVPDDEYVVKYSGRDTKICFGTPRVFVHFNIVDPPEYREIKLFKPYPVRALIGHDGKNGRFKLGRGQNLYRDLCHLHCAKLRPDRVSLTALKLVLLRVTTKTVMKAWDGQPKPKYFRYSVVDKLLAVEAGSL